MLREVLITILALPCLVCAENDTVLISATLDVDLNFTVADVCQYKRLSRHLLCIQSEQVYYIRAGTCLTRQYNSVAFGMCPYFPGEYSW